MKHLASLLAFAWFVADVTTVACVFCVLVIP
jgi:hypothetical protein